MKNKLIKDLENYKSFNKTEQLMVDQTIKFLKENDSYLGKENLKGHITASTWIINSDANKCFLTHHKKLNLWLQLGGHTELNERTYESAYREGIEESGFSNLKKLSDRIYDVDVHLIPKNNNIPAHYHYDIRYLFMADPNDQGLVSHESHDIKWVDIDDIELYSKDASIGRMVDKMEAICLKNWM